RGRGRVGECSSFGPFFGRFGPRGRGADNTAGANVCHHVTRMEPSRQYQYGQFRVIVLECRAWNDTRPTAVWGESSASCGEPAAGGSRNSPTGPAFAGGR